MTLIVKTFRPTPDEPSHAQRPPEKLSRMAGRHFCRSPRREQDLAAGKPGRWAWPKKSGDPDDFSH